MSVNFTTNPYNGSIASHQALQTQQRLQQHQSAQQRGGRPLGAGGSCGSGGRGAGDSDDGAGSRRASDDDAASPDSDEGGVAAYGPSQCLAASKSNAGGVGVQSQGTIAAQAYYNAATMAPQYSKPLASGYYQHGFYPGTPSRFYGQLDAGAGGVSSAITPAGYAHHAAPSLSSMTSSAPLMAPSVTSNGVPSMTSSSALDENVLSAASYAMGMAGMAATGQNPFYAAAHSHHQPHHAFYAMMGQSAAAAAGQPYFGTYPFVRMGQFGEKKRGRQTYSRWTTSHLEQEFKQSKYLNRSHRVKLSQFLQLTERQIKIWFQNRRMKYKKETKNTSKDESGAESSKPAVTTSTPNTNKDQSSAKTGHPANPGCGSSGTSSQPSSTLHHHAGSGYSMASSCDPSATAVPEALHGSIGGGSAVPHASNGSIGGLNGHGSGPSLHGSIGGLNGHGHGTVSNQSYYYPANPYPYPYPYSYSAACHQNQLQHASKFDSYYLAASSAQQASSLGQ